MRKGNSKSREKLQKQKEGSRMRKYWRKIKLQQEKSRIRATRAETDRSIEGGAKCRRRRVNEVQMSRKGQKNCRNRKRKVQKEESRRAKGGERGRRTAEGGVGQRKQEKGHNQYFLHAAQRNSKERQMKPQESAKQWDVIVQATTATPKHSHLWYYHC